jgi:hypothetical protein
MNVENESFAVTVRNHNVGFALKQAYIAESTQNALRGVQRKASSKPFDSKMVS